MEDAPTCVVCGEPVPPPKKYASEPKKYCSARCRRDRWRQDNLEQDKAVKRAYWEAHREHHKQTSLARYYANREQMLEECKTRYQKSRLETPWRVPINAANARCAAKGWPCDLDDAWGRRVWTGRCALSDIPFVLGTPKGEPKLFSPSIDRVVPALGYVQSNCRFVLDAINAMKGTGTDEDVFRIAEAIVRKHRP